MTFKRTATSLAALAITSMTLIPMATAASARDYGRRGGDYSPRVEQRHFNKGGDFGRHDYGRRDFGGHARWHKKRHKGRDVALGAFAAIVGLAIAAEAARAHDRDYDDYRY